MTKRIKKLPIIILVLIIIFCGTIITVNNFPKEKEQDKNIQKENEKPIQEVEDFYKDDNPFLIALYTSENGFNKITEHSNIYKMSTDIGVFTVFASNENTVTGSFQPTWWSLWKSFKNYEKYKIGYNIQFTHTKGEVNKNILKPSDGEDIVFYPYLFVYLYDDVNITPGTWNPHIEDHQVNENTLFTSIKLTGHLESHNTITSPIKLTVFTYKSDDDFDPETKQYRGKSAYTILIKQTP